MRNWPARTALFWCLQSSILASTHEREGEGEEEGEKGEGGTSIFRVEQIVPLNGEAYKPRA